MDDALAMPFKHEKATFQDTIKKKKNRNARVKKKRNLPTLEQCGHKCALFSFPRHTRQLNNSDRFCS